MGTLYLGVAWHCGRLHHVAMHHTESNGRADTSSTECFQRDSSMHFLMYWARFVVGIFTEVPYYAVRGGRTELLAPVLCCGGCYFAVFFKLWGLNAAATVRAP